MAGESLEGLEEGLGYNKQMFFFFFPVVWVGGPGLQKGV